MDGPACKEGGGLATPASEGVSQIGEEKKGEEGEEGSGRGRRSKLRDVSEGERAEVSSVMWTAPSQVEAASPEFVRSDRARERKATP